MQARITKRYAAEKRFRAYGVAALLTAAAFLVFLLGNLISNGLSGFMGAQVRLTVPLDAQVLGVTAAEATTQAGQSRLANADYTALVSRALRERFGVASGTPEARAVQQLVSLNAGNEVRAVVAGDPSQIGTAVPIWFTAGSEVELVLKNLIDESAADADRIVSRQMVDWVRTLERENNARLAFNGAFFVNGDSREPELAGIGGAIVGSFLTLLVTLALCFPIGVAAAVYLEEFAPKNAITDFIEVNINNLAAVPSIVFGLLGLAVFLGTFGLPRSAPLVGGLTLALMTLPTIVIAARVAIKAVPPSIRDAAVGLGASPLQVVQHHVLPLAMPGILTGTIIGMSRALGETAPLLMIGMVAFIVDVPSGVTSPSTVLPVQVFIWSDSPERLFREKTAAAILVLLSFLILMNGLAIYLRNRFERRW
jgi:phosphate transport system permease protein